MKKEQTKSKRGIPISISLSPLLVDKIDKEADREGLSRSKFLGMLIYNRFKDEDKNESTSKVQA